MPVSLRNINRKNWKFNPSHSQAFHEIFLRDLIGYVVEKITRKFGNIAFYGSLLKVKYL